MELLHRFVKFKGWHILKTYIDDGYSGTNFDRPDFKRMINDIES
ncbi:MAG: recombinase family protein [Clostridium sp.]|nr:recombinase family protein [Clostridium sp.]